MTLWTLIPRDPLIFRDGRPFNANAGARAKSLPFPFPSTIAGAVRTLLGTDPVTGDFDKTRIAELLEVQIRGPLLVELDQDGQITDWLFPAPADALILKHTDPEEKRKARRLQILPVKLPNDSQTDLSELNSELSLVGLLKPGREKGKPHPNAPRYWRKDVFETWLKNPRNGEITLAEIGHHGPAFESRMHVSIASETGTGVPGALFQTSGLEFVQRETDDREIYPKLKDAKSLALVVETGAALKPGLGFLGGERRVVQWQPSKNSLPACPDDVRKKIMTKGTCRLMLLTPAIFEHGYKPHWILKQHGVQATVMAAAVQRYQTVSGWDYKERKPKATRRLAPAGSVYYLKLDGRPDNINDFVNSLWMQNISDNEQDRRDGFGLVVFGTWNGESPQMEVPND